MPRLRSPHEGFGQMAGARPKYDVPPPPWPKGDDPRTPECRHDWTTQWGQIGERQHQCKHCDRWIWERAIWPVDSDARDHGLEPADPALTGSFGVAT